MNSRLQHLKYILQVLALPVIGQVRLIDDDDSRVEILAGAFNAGHYAVRAEVDEVLTTEQVKALVRLENRLVLLCHESSSPLCSELAMRKSSEWRQVRTMAREALIRFRWSLELPSVRGHPLSGAANANMKLARFIWFNQP